MPDLTENAQAEITLSRGLPGACRFGALAGLSAYCRSNISNYFVILNGQTDGRSEHTGESGKGHGFIQQFEDENALVASRAESLDLMNSRVIAGDNGYLVEVRFMVGSFTWTAVPPVATTIAFSEQDCVRLVELLFMISLSVG